jgi:hypothetical protein
VLAVDPIASAAAAGAGAGVDPHADKENRKSAEVTEVRRIPHGVLQT